MLENRGGTKRKGSSWTGVAHIMCVNIRWKIDSADRRGIFGDRQEKGCGRRRGTSVKVAQKDGPLSQRRLTKKCMRSGCRAALSSLRVHLRSFTVAPALRLRPPLLPFQTRKQTVAQLALLLQAVAALGHSSQLVAITHLRQRVQRQGQGVKAVLGSRTRCRRPTVPLTLHRLT